MFTTLCFAQSKVESSPDNYQLNLQLSSGVNYTPRFNSTVKGTYRLNSIPVLSGIEILYKNSYGIELTSGYLPIMFYNNVQKLKTSSITVDASLISFPVIMAFKYIIYNFSVSAGGVYYLIKSDISLNDNDTNTDYSSFGYTAGIEYRFDISKSFRLSPKINYYRIPELNSSTYSFLISLSYRLFEF
jgi:hypothetical protein